MYVYLHVCCINNWKEIFNKLLEDIIKSTLYNKVIEIRCNILTTNNDDLKYFNDSKIKIIGISDKLDLYEFSTINLLYEHSLLEDFNVLYIHTKGVKHNNTSSCVTDWVKYLSYFNIYKHETCINELSTYDVVGVNLQDEPILHFSGNFWWTKSQYIRKLKKCYYINYISPECWITESKIGNYLSLWNSNINHYNEKYEESNYVDKSINLDLAFKRIFNNTYSITQ